MNERLEILKGANHLVPFHPTHGVIDSTKIKSFQECPRQFFWEYVMGWKLEGRNVLHLLFGEAWHLGMERLLQDMKEHRRYTDEGIAEAYNLFYDKYSSVYDDSWEADNNPKNAANALRAFTEYAQHWAADDFDVLHTEVSGDVPISEDRVLTLRMDGVIQDSQGICDMDHKTASQETHNYADQFVLGVQLGTYTHALFCMYDEKDIYGAKINATFLRKKNNGFGRFPVRKTADDMVSWLHHVNWWVSEIERNMLLLAETKVEDEYMEAFPLRPPNCTNWGRTCPYFEMCMRFKNPLQALERPEPEIGFEVDFWDPRSIQTEDHKVEFKQKLG